MKEWIVFGWENCPECGYGLLVLADGDGLFGDGDEIKCSECGFEGSASVDSESGEMWLNDPIE